MKRTKIIDALQCTEYGKDINVKGWVRSHRNSKAVDFIALNDGSTINNIQIVVDPTSMDADTLKSITTGACISELAHWYKAKVLARLSKYKVRRLRFTAFVHRIIRCKRRDKASNTCESMRIYASERIPLGLYSASDTIWLLPYISTFMTMVSIISIRQS